VTLVRPEVIDACTNGDLATVQVRINGGAWGPIPVLPFDADSGTTLVVDYRATDICGNVSEVVRREYDLTDRIPPYAICETFRVASLGANCRLRIHAEAFDDGSWDNCGIERMEVRRMTPACDIGTAFGPFVDFCCEDAVQAPVDINNHPTQIIFRVTDTSGNTNECMVRVRVEDKLPPVTQNLPNLTIDCNDEILHWSGWAAVPANSTLSAARLDELDELFGRLVAAEIGDNSGRRPISVATGNARIAGVQTGFAFLDGTYYDNCLNTACIEFVRRAGFVAGPDCRTGVITRTFTVTDRGGNVRTVTQSITVTNFYPFMGGPNRWSTTNNAYNATGYYTTFRSGSTTSTDPRTWPIYAPTSGAAGTQNGNNEYGEPRSVFRALGTGGATSVTATGANGYPTRFDMVWPADLDVTDCAQGLDPDALAANAATRTGARPYLWREDVCSTVGVTYDEWVFDFEAGCKKVIRKWKAIDWCQPQSITNPWFQHQVIKVVDTQGPSFVSVTATVRPGTDVTAQCGQTEAVVFEFLEGCENGAVRFVVEAFDACATDAEVDAIRWSWEITPAGGGLITSAGQNIPRGNTLTFNQNLPRTLPGGAAHSIKFIAEDGCGNKSTCVIPFRVEDRKKPTPIAFTNLSTEVMPEGPAAGSVQVMASLFNNGSNDNCTVTGFRLGQFTQAGQDTYTGGPRHLRTPVNTHTSLIFVCKASLLPAGLSADEARQENATQYRLVNPGQVVEVAFWAGDEYGNWDYTIVAVRVDNNMGADCDEGSFTGVVAGLIKTEIEEAVEFADVDVMVSGFSAGYTNMTNVTGTYQVTVPLMNNYTVAPERNDAIRNGVNVQDIIAIQRHILGVERLTSPYQQIAADANRSNTITAQDLVDIRRVLLNPVGFTNNTSWRFVDAEYTFNDPLNALSENFPETITINPMDDDRMNVDFVGVKIGDVNNSVRANSSSLNGTTSRSRAMELVAAEMNLKAGNEYTVSFRSEDIANVEGYQFTLNFDASKVAFAGYNAVGLNLTDENFGFALLEEGMVTTAWHTLDAVELTGSDVLFTMTFRALGEAKLSEVLRATSSFTEAMAVSNGTAIGLNLVFETNAGIVSGDVYELFQNQPNPFANETIIGFTLPESMNATLSVFDVTGKMVKMIEGNYAKGMNNVIIKRSELPASGVLYYQLEAGDFRATKKMIIIE